MCEVTDVINIIGAGLAGLSAALALAETGIKCRLISAQNSERAQSVLAEGGINAALNTMGEGDTTELHFDETMKGGAYLADPNAVKALTDNAPSVVRKLAELGVPFNRNPDGSLALRSFGGQKKKRTAFAQSSTGKMIMTALTDEVRRYEAKGLVTRLPHHTFVRLLTNGVDCTGVRIKDTYTGKLYDLSGAVIAALGGLNGFFPDMTTGTVTNSGTAAAVIFAQGVKFANLEMIQYHPTTIGIPGKRCLISEAARSEGGRLCVMKDGYPMYFMEMKYPEFGSLMPRDIVSREIFFTRRELGDVFLDMTGISEDAWKNKLSDLREEIMHYFPLDPKKDPVPVEPGIHYFMGGIYVNERHEASIRGLYAAGECACQYHGANRLGGNSLLGTVFGGMTAAKSASSYAGAGNDKMTEYNGEELLDCELPAGSDERLGNILISGLGIVRNGNTIKSALDRLDAVQCTVAAEKVRKELGRAMLLSALGRMESRGAHYREDCTDTIDLFASTTVAQLAGGTVRISFEEIPERKTGNGSNV